MAVTMTAMLAIIGSSFVLVTRLQRQTVRSFANVQGIDQIQDYVIRKIQTTLAADVVSPNPTGFPAQGLDRLRSVVLSAAGTAQDNTSGPNATYKPYNAPDPGNVWLAPTEPLPNLDWPRVSDVFGSRMGGIPGFGTVTASVCDPSMPANVPNAGDVPFIISVATTSVADADGDGIADSIWRAPPELQRDDGKYRFVALRIIDNCGMLNVNTAWEMIPAVYTNWDTYGMLPNQLNLGAVLELARTDFSSSTSARGWPSGWTVGGEVTALEFTRLMQKPANWKKPQTDQYGSLLDSVSRVRFMNSYADWVLRFYEAPSVFALGLQPGSPNLPSPLPNTWPMPYDLGASAMLFDISDELALRNRFCLKSASTSRIEGSEALWNAIGDDINNPLNIRQRTPFTDPAVWARALLGDPASDPPYCRDVRHLLTAYSFDRTVRPQPDGRQTQNAGGVFLDGSLDDPTWPGPFRQLDINRAVDALVRYDTANPVHLRAAAELACAVAYAFYVKPALPPTDPNVVAAKQAAMDQAVQYVANLRDYLDQESPPTASVLTHYAPGSISMAAGWTTVTVPSKDIFGYERQPFITEVFCQLSQGGDTAQPPNMTMSAVELCNPYDTNISLAGWKIYQGSTEKGTLLGTYTVPAAAPDPTSGFYRPGRLVIRTGAPLVDTASEPAVTSQDDTSINLEIQSDAPLTLVRPVSGTDLTEVVVDYVSGADMGEVTGKSGASLAANEVKNYSIQRATCQAQVGCITAVSAWRFARNEFRSSSDATITNVDGLGRWLGKQNQPVPAPALVRGVPLPVADRVALPMPNEPLKVRGWYEVVRSTFIGNPSKTDFDTNLKPAGLADANYAPVTEQIGPRGAAFLAGGLADIESSVRFNLGDPQPDARRNKTRKLFETLGFFVRCDDGIDNDNEDKDGDANVNPLNLPLLTSRVSPYAGGDELSECRIPGRINVNTAPEPVLRAVFPLLMDAQVTSAEMATVATWFAKAVVYIRRVGGPFTGLDDFARRVAEFNNPTDTLTGLPVITGADAPPPGRTRILWFPQAMAELDRIVARAPIPRNVGDRYAGYLGDPAGAYAAAADYSDFEERDWLLGRMANLLTVRSDTFTAYILIRIQSQANAADFSERRVMAIFDRSNVFLPPGMSKPPNNVNDSQDPGVPASDMNARDRLYVTPKVVAIQPVPEAN